MAERYALIGHPLGHSFSPWLHERLFALRGKEASYDLLDFDAAALDGAEDSLRALAGYNVTIPYKTAMLARLDALDASAADCGAVNCVRVRDGRQTGFNTDRDGFLQSLPAGALAGRVLLVGCGGAGQMMATEVAKHGGRLTIAVRESARERVMAFAGSFAEITELSAVAGDFDLLLNATPVGMFPHTDACPVPDALLARCGRVFDVIYNPAPTLLLQKAAALGIPTTDGAEMLVRQAACAQTIWYGAQFSEDELRGLIAALRARLSAEKGGT